VSPSGRFAYTGNASGSISGFAIDRDGAVGALATTALVPSPRDLAFDESGRFLYAVSPGTAATGGQVTSYRVGHDGSLTVTGTVGRRRRDHRRRRLLTPAGRDRRTGGPARAL